jgi:hypothetical protein
MGTVQKLGSSTLKHMSHNSSSIPSASRLTLKLKPGTRKSPREVKTPSPRPQSKLSQKPGAAWSDELNQRMQRDMDALMTR